MATSPIDDDITCAETNTLPMPDAYIDADGQHIDEWGHPIDNVDLDSDAEIE